VSERWTRRRRRARQLVAAHPFAAEMLTLYQALLNVQELVFRGALVDQPRLPELEQYVAERVLPTIVAATQASGPLPLAGASARFAGAADAGSMVGRWLRDEAQPPAERYLARAAAGPVLEALDTDALAGLRAGGDGRRCPRCAGSPQLSYVEDSGDPLVTAPRWLLCTRCAGTWIHERMSCPGCGETSSARLPIYAESERLAHLRADGCERCRRYLITVDLRRAPEAVPEVDELAALPLDLYVQGRGFAKIAPNLMGIG
jgi:FdhE protein